MTLPSSISADITALISQYNAGIYAPPYLFWETDISVKNRGYIASDTVVFLKSGEKMIHAAPSCVAARVVYMQAKNTISLGMPGAGCESSFFSLYAPGKVHITTKHLSVGNIKLVVEPQTGVISCTKLTLLSLKSRGEKAPEHEIMESWLENETEVVTLWM